MSFKEKYSSVRKSSNSTGALASAKNKHITLYFKLLEELVKSGTVIVPHKNTEQMLTDNFTKCLEEIVAFGSIITQSKEYLR